MLRPSTTILPHCTYPASFSSRSWSANRASVKDPLCKLRKDVMSIRSETWGMRPMTDAFKVGTCIDVHKTLEGKLKERGYQVDRQVSRYKFEETSFESPDIFNLHSFLCLSEDDTKIVIDLCFGKQVVKQPGPGEPFIGTEADLKAAIDKKYPRGTKENYFYTELFYKGRYLGGLNEYIQKMEAPEDIKTELYNEQAELCHAFYSLDKGASLYLLFGAINILVLAVISIVLNEPLYVSPRAQYTPDLQSEPRSYDCESSLLHRLHK